MMQNLTIKRGPGRRPLGLGSAEDTRRDIFRHALRLINERGYVDVSMTDIAQAAGLTKATLYYHFASKADLLTEGALDMLGRVRAHVERIAGDHAYSVRERLVQMALARQQRPLGATYNASMMDAAMTQLSDAQRERLHQAFDAIDTPLHDLIVEGIARGELRDVDPRHIALAFRQLFSESRRKESGVDQDAANHALLSIFFEGAGGRESN
jgi:TetR/AcrR family transcriptional regulator, mexJK operon transcriptional repressor